MPVPCPIRRQQLRSSGLAWARRGYQPSGAESVRPSSSSTVKASLDTETCCAFGIEISVCEIIIPCLHYFFAVLHHQIFDLDKFAATKPDAVLQPYRSQPELCKRRIALDMNVHRLFAVTGVKEEP